MKIKFSIVYNDVMGSYISDEGELEVKNFDGYELFCRLYEKIEGEGSKCGVSKEEFKESYEVMDMRDWLVVRDVDGIGVMNFVKVG
jgi:hypothetical protein